ncbi:hypothetical protein [Actinospica robiniae]|nr:hypothetical protein [Actinospica robiniae]
MAAVFILAPVVMLPLVLLLGRIEQRVLRPESQPDGPGRPAPGESA